MSLDRLIARLHGKGRLRVWSLAATFLGDAVAPRGGSIAMADLSAHLETLGAEPGAIRTALSRLARDGWVERTKVGRRSYYRLAGPGAATTRAATPRIYAAAPPEWNGRWTVVMAPPGAPEAGLAAAGLHRMAPGVWLAPAVDDAAGAGDGRAATAADASCGGSCGGAAARGGEGAVAVAEKEPRRADGAAAVAPAQAPGDEPAGSAIRRRENLSVDAPRGDGVGDGIQGVAIAATAGVPASETIRAAPASGASAHPAAAANASLASAVQDPARDADRLDARSRGVGAPDIPAEAALFRIDGGVGAPPEWVRARLSPPELGARYQALLDDWCGFEPATAATPALAMAARTLLIHDWRRVLLRDAPLPRAFRPEGWPGALARDRVAALYRALAAPSERWLDRCEAAPDTHLPLPDTAFAARFGGL